MADPRRKYLIVGCGGSGGETLRYAMDQLRADLRAKGVREIPAAWQFLHIDVPVQPEATSGIGDVRDLGGHYVSVSSAGNMYSLVANSVQTTLGSRDALRELAGWAPRPEPGGDPSGVPVTNGAGQYRAIGRMLTLTRLSEIQNAVQQAWQRIQAPTAWGDLPTADPAGGPYGDSVIPIVVASIAGGSGAAMFLDVCRILGRVPGLDRNNLGVFLYTPDVFAVSLPPGARKGVDGNALGAIGDLIAAQLRTSDTVDNALFDALGLPPDTIDAPAFRRIFPIGSAIGSSGARFGDGTASGVFRGLGRALAATFSSPLGNDSYRRLLENDSPIPTDVQKFGWGTSGNQFNWGSYGYASLSLGRDRYADYASQRLARAAVDRLVEGHLDGSARPSTEQVNTLVDDQWITIVRRLALPQAGESIKPWFEQLITRDRVDAESHAAVNGIQRDLDQGPPGMQAETWLNTLRSRLPMFQNDAAQQIADSAYRWAEWCAADIERRVLAEFLNATKVRGLPYAVKVLERLTSHLSPIAEELQRQAPIGAAPLELDDVTAGQIAALGKRVLQPAHTAAVSAALVTSARRAFLRESSRQTGQVLATFLAEVVPALQRAGRNALANLEAARAATGSEAGLAQLKTTIYPEWPREGSDVPARFDHAENEVLVTTSREFPERFAEDVVRTIPGATIYEVALREIVTQVIEGTWETTGGIGGDYEVLATRVPWRSSALPRDSRTGESATRSIPTYDLALSTEQILERATAYQQRPNEPFEQFSKATFTDYLQDPSASEADQAQRLEVFVQRFKDTLQLAQPLVGASQPMIQAIHGQGQKYEYVFGPVPLARVPAAADRLTQLLDADASLEITTKDAFTSALSDGTENKIAVFGAYPKYAPVVYTSLLKQVQDRVTAAQDAALDDLWRWKRTRPLRGSLAMSRDEMRALVKGWYLGRLLGLVTVPANTMSTTPVQVWDPVDRSWRSFPVRLLTPRSKYRGQHDWLPGVLEGHTLALVQANNDVHLTSLLPYVALRRIADDSPTGPNQAYDGTSGRRMLQDWIQTGTWTAEGRPSEVPTLAAAAVGSVTERLAAAQDWATQVREHLAGIYLTSGGGLGSLGKPHTKIDNVAQLQQAPLFAEIAELVDEILDEIAQEIAGIGAQLTVNVIPDDNGLVF